MEFSLNEGDLRRIRKNVSEKVCNLPLHLRSICTLKKIEVADEDSFVLNNRTLILDYHRLTGDYESFIKNMLEGKAILNEEQLEEYQRKDLVRANGEFCSVLSYYSDLC